MNHLQKKIKHRNSILLYNIFIPYVISTIIYVLNNNNNYYNYVVTDINIFQKILRYHNSL